MKYILTIDQSTSASKAFLVDESGAIVRRASRPHQQYYPKDGYAEHDAEEIYANVCAIMDEVSEGVMDDIAAVSIANQRETCVLWERATGKPVHRAIVWQDVRGQDVCQALAGKADYVLKTTGMALSPYYPASKVAHLLTDRPDIRERCKAGEICMGTIESYLVFCMTGRHVSDLSNASRTQLLNLHTLQWDDGLIEMFGLEKSMLAPELLPTDGDFGTWKGIPITGVMGDSHATLFGQGCVTPGSIKVSYGTGSSVMMNIGDKPTIMESGALTTAIAFNYGGKVHYQTEGNITCSCDTLVWLCREMGMFADADEIEKLAGTVPDSLGVSLVPALSGLGAPFFDVDARAIICGLSRGATKAHIARAALESVANRDSDVTEAMTEFTGKAPDYMMADGGGAKNGLMMQLQADLAGCEVRCSAAGELSALGAAYMAGLKTGVYKSLEDIPARHAPMRVYRPEMPVELRKEMRARWIKAIERARLK